MSGIGRAALALAIASSACTQNFDLELPKHDNAQTMVLHFEDNYRQQIYIDDMSDGVSIPLAMNEGYLRLALFRQPPAEIEVNIGFEPVAEPEDSLINLSSFGPSLHETALDGSDLEWMDVDNKAAFYEVVRIKSRTSTLCRDFEEGVKVPVDVTLPDETAMNGITSVAGNGSDTGWVITENGVFEVDAFGTIRTSALLGQFFFEGFMDDAGDLWLGRNDGVIVKYMPDTSSVAEYPLDTSSGPVDEIKRIVGHGEELYVATHNGSLQQFRGSGFEEIVRMELERVEGDPLFIAWIRPNEIIVGGGNGGIYRIKDGSVSREPIPGDPAVGGGGHDDRIGTIVAIGAFVVGGVRGLVKYDDEMGTWELFKDPGVDAYQGYAFNFFQHEDGLAWTGFVPGLLAVPGHLALLHEDDIFCSVQLGVFVPRRIVRIGDAWLLQESALSQRQYRKALILRPDDP